MTKKKKMIYILRFMLMIILIGYCSICLGYKFLVFFVLMDVYITTCYVLYVDEALSSIVSQTSGEN